MGGGGGGGGGKETTPSIVASSMTEMGETKIGSFFRDPVKQAFPSQTWGLSEPQTNARAALQQLHQRAQPEVQFLPVTEVSDFDTQLSSIVQLLTKE